MLKFNNNLGTPRQHFEKIAIGNFDGVHIGHQRILKELDNNDLIITFTNLKKKEEIYPIEVKLLLLKEYCENIIILDYEHIKNCSKTNFINYLKNFKPSLIIAGQDFTFGARKSGTVEDLKKHFDIKIVKYVERDKQKVSSSTIRNYLKEGKIKQANRLLSRPFTVTDIIVAGHGRGHNLGIPTINFIVPKKLKIKRGVYETRVIINNKKYKSVTNIGRRPTFDNGKESIETHVLDFDGDVYGKVVTLEFMQFLRDEKKFDSPKKLVTQINRDIKQVLSKKGNDIYGD